MLYLRECMAITNAVIVTPVAVAAARSISSTAAIADTAMMIYDVLAGRKVDTWDSMKWRYIRS